MCSYSTLLYASLQRHAITAAPQCQARMGEWTRTLIADLTAQQLSYPLGRVNSCTSAPTPSIAQSLRSVSTCGTRSNSRNAGASESPRVSIESATRHQATSSTRTEAHQPISRK